MTRLLVVGLLALGCSPLVGIHSASGTDDTTDPDKPFGSPQWLIHITGHGTVNGPEKDDALVIDSVAPNEKGEFLIADGSGGTIGYGSDFHAGPFNKPSEVCAAAAGKLDASHEIGSFSHENTVECNPFLPGGGTTSTAATSNSTPLSGLSTGTSTVTTNQSNVCNIRGTVTDAFGEPVPDIHIQVNAGGLSLDTSTLADGSYSFAEIGDNPAGGVFDSRTDPVTVELIVEEQTHSPQRYIVYYREVGNSLSTPPFLIPDSGQCQYDFDMGSIPTSYNAVGAPITDWPALVQMYQGIHSAWALADMLGINLAYGLPLQVMGWCDSLALKCNGKAGAFFLGSTSDGSQTVDRPYIAIEPSDSGLTSPNRPDNREFHEFGHYVLASAFNGLPDTQKAPNHAGYPNASSADSWIEGFAEFWSTMVNKYIVQRPSPEFYNWVGGASDMTGQFEAWDDEEFSIASVLYKLESLDIAATPPPTRAPRTYKVNGYTVINDATYGQLVVGTVTNTTPATSYGTFAGAIFYDANKRVIDGSYGTTIPADLGSGGKGVFVLAVPKGLTFSDLAITVVEGRPKPPSTGSAPFDVTLAQIWSAISSYHSTKELSAGHVFDADDLYQALKAAFGGQGPVVDGVDAIDALFIDAGLFEDVDGDRQYAPGDAIGPTSHPAYGDQDACSVKPQFGCSVTRVPRAGKTGTPAQTATIHLLAPDNTEITGEVYAQVMYPSPHQDQSYGFVVTPDADGSVILAVPPPKSGATVLLVGISDGHLPAVLGTIDAAKFWTDAAAANGQQFMSFSATLMPGDFTIPTGAAADLGAGGSSSGGVGATSILILIGGLFVAVAIGLFLTRRRRAPA